MKQGAHDVLLDHADLNPERPCDLAVLSPLDLVHDKRLLAGRGEFVQQNREPGNTLTAIERGGGVLGQRERAEVFDIDAIRPLGSLLGGEINGGVARRSE